MKRLFKLKGNVTKKRDYLKVSHVLLESKTQTWTFTRFSGLVTHHGLKHDDSDLDSNSSSNPIAVSAFGFEDVEEELDWSVGKDCCYCFNNKFRLEHGLLLQFHCVHVQPCSGTATARMFKEVPWIVSCAFKDFKANQSKSTAACEIYNWRIQKKTVTISNLTQKSTR